MCEHGSNHATTSHTSRRKACISSTRSVEYHQAAGRGTLTRDEIQAEGLMICTALRAAMSYQACGLDKKNTLERVCFFEFIV